MQSSKKTEIASIVCSFIIIDAIFYRKSVLSFVLTHLKLFQTMKFRFNLWNFKEDINTDRIT